MFIGHKFLAYKAFCDVCMYSQIFVSRRPVIWMQQLQVKGCYRNTHADPAADVAAAATAVDVADAVY